MKITRTMTLEITDNDIKKAVEDFYATDEISEFRDINLNRLLLFIIEQASTNDINIYNEFYVDKWYQALLIENKKDILEKAIPVLKNLFISKFDEYIDIHRKDIGLD